MSPSAGGCAWTAASNAGFINVTSGAKWSGTEVSLFIAANDTVSPAQWDYTMGVRLLRDQDGPHDSTRRQRRLERVHQLIELQHCRRKKLTTVIFTVNRVGDASGAASVDTTLRRDGYWRRDYIMLWAV